MRIACFSTFDILPANDGGRRRYLAIMSQLAQWHDVTIIGYDLTGTLPVREYVAADRLHIAMAQAAPADAAHCWQHFSKTGRIAHDVLCVRDYRLNSEFLGLCERHVRPADVVIVSHPYMILQALTFARPGAIIVYEAHNVELDAKSAHFADTDPAMRAEYLTDVDFAERLACQSAHYVTAVSDADARRLEELYDLSAGSVFVSANGVDVSAYPVATDDDRQRFRVALNIPSDHDVGVFLGSGYGPNVASYRQLRLMLAEAGFGGTVVLVGSIANADRDDWPPVPFSENWLGYVPDDSVKALAISCADFALQFMFEGAGTNLKLFDYMAARTLIIGNRFGFRGVVDAETDWRILAETTDELRDVLRDRPWATSQGTVCAENAHALVESHYDWAVIGERFNQMLLGDAPAPALANERWMDGHAIP